MAPVTLDVTEGASSQLAVRLSVQPPAAVTVDVMASNTGVITTAPSMLSFTTANWNIDQTVTVFGAADVNTANETASVTFSSTGLPSVVATITVMDDDVLGIAPSTTNLGTLNEGGVGSFSVQLTHQPPGNVVIAVVSSDVGAATAAPPNLTFSTSNWMVPQTVSVSLPQDDDTADESVTLTLSSTGLMSRAVALTVDDDDVLTIQTSATSVVAGEGSTTTFTVRLSAQPAASVTVGVVSSDPTAATAAPAMLTFTPGNYATAQLVTVTGVEDVDLTNEFSTLTVSSTGLPSVMVGATVTDNDMQTVVVSAPTLSLTEGGSGSFTVALGFVPSATTTVSIGTSNALAAAPAVTMLTFTPGNYATPQTVAVNAPQDADAANGVAVITASASGATPGVVNVDITDDDSLSLETTVSTLTVGEAGSATFGVRLTAQPGGSVTVATGSSDSGAATAAPPSLTFTTGNWNTFQTVTVSGVADLDLTNESATVTVSSAGLASRTVTVTVTDDDAQAIVSSHANLTVGEGASADITVRLAFQPAANVTVTVATTSATVAGVSPATLTFTPGNYAVTQTVTISSAADATFVHDLATVTLTAPGATSAIVAVTQEDDDLLSVTSAGSFTLCPGDAADLTVRLNGPPLAPSLVVGAASNNVPDAVVAPASRTFTTSDFAVGQLFSITAVSQGMAVITISAPGQVSRTVSVTVLSPTAPACVL